MRFERLIQEGTVLRRVVAKLIASYYIGVHRTARVTMVPDDAFDIARREGPAIYTFWHGQGFMAPWMVPPGVDFMPVIARNSMAGLIADAAAIAGIQSIRASGSHRRRAIVSKGGVIGFRQALRQLESGISIAITADVPKVGQVAGAGVIQMARLSGRPIIPVAYISRFGWRLDNWDHLSIDFPFSRAAVVHGAPMHIPRDAEADTIEMARRQLTETLDRITLDAYERTGIAAKFKPGPGADG